jgi:hypothetical protein
MEKSTTNISPYVNNEETNNVNNQKANESIDTIAFYLFEAIKRKSNQQLQRKGA